MQGLASDVVVTGENRPELGALVVADMDAVRALLRRDGEPADLLRDPLLRAAAAERMADHFARATGSSTRIARMMFLEEPLVFDRGEVTDKGSINQRAVLRNRQDLVEALYSDDPRVIRPQTHGMAV
jgi:feruloyl-CoA synthase